MNPKPTPVCEALIVATPFAAVPIKTAKLATPLNSHALLGDNKEVAINHNGALYRLSTTKLGKLILTK